MSSSGQRFSLVLTEYCTIDREQLRAFSVTQVRDELALRDRLRCFNTDCAVLGYKKNHEQAARIAAELTQKTGTAVLLLEIDPIPEPVRRQCISSGVLVCKGDDFGLMAEALLCMRIRLRSLEDKNDTLQQKLDDTKLVNRAKLLLMTRLNMTENQAHRYIEKTAMDSSRSRREVSENIIRIYEE